MTRARRHINISLLLAVIVLLSPSFLLSACSSGDDGMNEPTPQENQEIRFNPGVWNFMEGTRASKFDSNEDLQAGTLKCYAYEDGTTNLYIDGSTVSYSNPQWTFNDGKHYWPMTGSLNFFAFMPAGLENTFCTFDPTVYDSSTNPDGYSEDSPRITCSNLPIAIIKGSDSTKELVVAYTANQSKAEQGSTGVILTFKHPFAKVKFKLAAASGTNVKVNSITIPSIKRNGIFAFNGTTVEWTLSGDDANFVLSGNPATDDEAFYLVIPNNYGSKTLTVNATWSDWSNVTKDISADVTFNWTAGYSYTYTLTLSKEALKVDVEKYTEQW